MYGDIVASARADSGLVGSFFWSAVGSTYKEVDDFSISMNPSSGEDDHIVTEESSLADPENLPSGSPHGSVCIEPQEKPQNVATSVSAGQAALTVPPNLTDRTAEDERTVQTIRKHAATLASLDASWVSECLQM